MTGEAGLAVSGCRSKEKRHIIDVVGKVYMQKKIISITRQAHR